MRWISPFTHLSAVPQVAPDWAGLAGLLVVAGLLGATGVVGFARRDLRG